MTTDLAIVTGGCRGIGQAIADDLQETGYEVARACRCVGFNLNLSDLASGGGRDGFPLDSWWNRLLAERGRPSVLVNNAGMVRPEPFDSAPMYNWLETFRVNFFGAVYMTQRFVAASPGGVIVNIASTAGQRPSPGWAAYAASKAALINFSETLAVELAPAFRVYCVAPGRTATALRAQLAPDEDPESIMQPQEVAAVVSRIIQGGWVQSGAVVEVKQVLSGC